MTPLIEQARQAAARALAEKLQYFGTNAEQVAAEMSEIALTAAAPHLAAVRVKKLEWHGPDYEDEYWASWLGGRYTIQANTDDGRWLGGVGGNFQSVDAAKAAAQADYEPRILSALEPSAGKAAVLEEAAIFEALEECETYFENRSDADHDEIGFVPNEEMRILVSVRAAIRALASHPVADKPDEAGAQGEGWMPTVCVGEMQTSAGADYYVCVKVGDREITPHMFKERWKAEYEVAEWQWLFSGGEKPDLLAYGTLSTPPSGEVV